MHKTYECNIFVTFSWHSVTVGVYLYSASHKKWKEKEYRYEKNKTHYWGCLSNHINDNTPVVTSVEKNDSMVVETVAEASQTPVLKSANVIPILQSEDTTILLNLKVLIMIRLIQRL